MGSASHRRQCELSLRQSAALMKNRNIFPCGSAELRRI
jgi:hypothetical protein